MTISIAELPDAIVLAILHHVAPLQCVLAACSTCRTWARLMEDLAQVDLNAREDDVQLTTRGLDKILALRALARLSLVNVGLEARGAAAVAEALKGSSTVLTTLDVSFNNLTEEATLGIVRAA